MNYKKIYKKITPKIIAFIFLSPVYITLFIMGIVTHKSLLSCLSYFFMMAGVIMNMAVIFLNNFKMPVKCYGYQMEHNRYHKTMNGRKRIRLKQLADIYQLRIRSKIIFFSLGDVCIWIGMLSSFAILTFQFI